MRLLTTYAPLFLLLAACGGKGEADTSSTTGDDDDDTDIVDTDLGDDDDDDDDTDGEDDSAEVAMVAADGGELSLGGATLTVPGGALSEDTTLTLTIRAPDGSLPDADSVVGSLYDFGPDGTTFSTPATLSLPLPSAPGTDQQAVVSWLDEGSNTWVDLASTVTDDVVSAPVEHFTTFAIRMVDAGGQPIECAEVVPCGGDLVGTWVIDAVCLDLPHDDPNCPGLEVDFFLNATGTLDFQTDGTYGTSVTMSTEVVQIIPASCVPSITSCDDLGSDDRTCVGDPAVECECTESTPPESTTTQGTWSASGTTVTLTSSGGSPDEAEYCVTGNAALLFFPTTGLTYALSR